MNEDPRRTFTRRALLRLVGAGTLGGLAAGSSGAAASAGPDGDARAVGPRESELLVGVSGAVAAGPHDPIRDALPPETAVANANPALRYVTLDLPDDADPERIADRLRGRDGVKYVERNRTVATAAGAADASAATDAYRDHQYVPDLVGAPTAWETADGGGATVAVVDTGVEHAHPDLAPNVTEAVGVDARDGDGDPSPDDPADTPHGTHVAGTAAAATGNGLGVAGVSDASLLAVKALDDAGGGAVSDIADGVVWSVDRGADVINLSVGTSRESETLRNAVGYARRNDVTVVSAAGNGDAESLPYPARYDEVVAVTAVDEDGAFAGFSNAGEAVDVTAPGVDVVSTVPEAGGSYGRMSGTSMAAPVVAGVAALVVDRWGVTDPEVVRSHLAATAADVGLPADEQGRGLVDAAAAVSRTPTAAGESGDGAAGSRSAGADAEADDGTRDSGGGSEGGGGSGDSETDGSDESDGSDGPDREPGATPASEGTGSGSLSGPGDRRFLRWTVESEGVERVSATLSAPEGTDFDLYGDVDEWPAPETALKRSESPTSDEAALFTDGNVDAGDEIRLLVTSDGGSGEFTVSVTEYAR